MKKLILIPILLLQVMVCHAQMDAELQRMAMRQGAQPAQARDAGEQSVRVIAQLKEGTSLSSLSKKLSPLGVRTISDYGRICVLSIPISSLQATSDLKEVEYLSTDHKIKANNDLARTEMNVDKVQNQAQASDLGLNGTYDGTGVLVGIVDCGIDFKHAALRDSSGNSRIRFAQIYDTRQGETPMCMDSVRRTYTKPDEIEQLTSDGAPMSHGSHTTCTAAGSAVTLNDSTIIQGMAPGAELLLSNMYSNNSETYDSYCMDAIFSQIQYAQQVGKPIVINCSFGELSVFCDGKEPFNVFCESLAGPGRIICVSAGNEANDMSTLEYVTKSDTDTLRTLLYDYRNFNGKGLKFKIISEDETPFQIRLGCMHLLEKKELPFQFFIQDSIPVIEDEVIHYSNDLMHDNRYMALVDIPGGFAVKKNEPYFIYVEVIGSKGKNYRIAAENIRLYGQIMMGSDRFIDGEDVNTQGYHCESDSVIAVGSYVSRESFLSYKGKTVKSTNDFQNPSEFSSHGHLVNGKSVPDVLAPGEFLLSAFNAYDSSRINQTTGQAADDYVYGYVEKYGHRSWYGWMRGTSMACPSATGVIALWLQADPTLGPSAIRRILQETSLVTSDLEEWYEEEEYGSGLLRADAGLKYILGPQTGVPAVSVPSWSESAIYDLNPHIYIKNGRKYWHTRE